MAKIISIDERRMLKEIKNGLNELDFSVSQLLQLSRRLPDSEGPIPRYTSMKEWLAELISKEIVRRNQMSEELFLCGLYIAAMLAEADCDLKKYAVDFLDKWSSSSDPKFLKMGGDFCFVLCGGFAARCDRRMMRLRDYQELGASFYDWFYSSTGKVIGRYMSLNFELMQEIVNTILTVRPQSQTT